MGLSESYHKSTALCCPSTDRCPSERAYHNDHKRDLLTGYRSNSVRQVAIQHCNDGFQSCSFYEFGTFLWRLYASSGSWKTCQDALCRVKDRKYKEEWETGAGVERKDEEQKVVGEKVFRESCGSKKTGQNFTFEQWEVSWKSQVTLKVPSPGIEKEISVWTSLSEQNKTMRKPLRCSNLPMLMWLTPSHVGIQPKQAGLGS